MGTSLAWMTEWAALSKRISGLLRAGEFYNRCQPISAVGSSQVAIRELLPNSREVFNLLGNFLERHRASLSIQAVASLEQFVERNREIFDINSERQTNPEVRTQFRLTALASFQGEFSFNLADFEAATRRVTERAFSHLQRSIVADPDIKKKWENAFKKGEVPCEKLGAVHLLSHGIWAFKADAACERTDLVMGDALTRPKQSRWPTEWCSPSGNWYEVPTYSRKNAMQPIGRPRGMPAVVLPVLSWQVIDSW